jgi:hypothetical protein
VPDSSLGTGLELRAGQGEEEAEPAEWGWGTAVGIQQGWRKHEEGMQEAYLGRDAIESTANRVWIMQAHLKHCLASREA